MVMAPFPSCFQCPLFHFYIAFNHGISPLLKYVERYFHYISFLYKEQKDLAFYIKTEKSSNKCKTLLAKHHFIILHNSVCALLVNLHRLPLFSFCSLLILLYLCQSCQFFLEQFAGGFPSEHLPWVVVNPVLYPLDIVLCPVIEVFSLRYLPAYQSVLVLVAATLK